MRNTLLLLLINVFHIFATESYSQMTNLSISLQDATVKEVLTQIENQSEFYFLYNSRLVDVNRKINIQVKDQKIDQVLGQLFNKTDVNYMIYNRQIILSPKEYIQGFIADMRQPLIISGSVTDQNGSPLPGVNIMEKGTNNGTISDMLGNYSISVQSSESVLVYSFIGFVSQEVRVGEQITINIELTEDIQKLDEVLVVGYGSMKKSDVTGAIQRVEAKNFETQKATNLVELLNGTVAGFNSNQGTGAAGGGSLEIRGATSLAANVNPLIVLDGVIYNGAIVDINPSDIESIDILKDASAAAVFGARSASGVIIITTKKGTISEPTISFSSKIGFSGLTKHMYPQSPEEYLTSRGDYWASNEERPEHYFTDPDKLPSGLSLDEWLNYDESFSEDPVETWFNRLGMTQIELDNYKAGKTVDWYDLVYRTGISQDYDVSLTGGTSKLKYYWSLGSTDNKGIVLGDDFKSIRSRVNIDANITDFLKVGVNAQYADRDQSSQSANLVSAIQASPYGNIYEEDGKTLTFYPHGDFVSLNPLLYNEYRDKLYQSQTLFATLFSEIKLPLGFSYRLSFSNNYYWNKDYYYDPVETIIGFQNSGYGSRTDNSSYEWQIDNIISWKKTFADIHSFDATFLYNAEKIQSWNSSMVNTQFQPTGILGYHGMQSGTTPSLSNDDRYVTGNAVMARLNYSLLDRYLFTGTWRRDGYSAFGETNPNADFYSAALGWRISEEEFFSVEWINYLKLRASWGENGNSAIDPYGALSLLGQSKYNYGNTMASGVYSVTMANTGLKWERTESINIGIDFGLFNSAISGSAEYYDMTTNDLLLARSLPSIIGYESVLSNMGELNNKGFELSLNSTNITNNNFSWYSSFVFSLNRNKIVHLYGEMVDVLDDNGNIIGQKEADDIGNRWFIGESMDRIWDYEILGVWQADEDEVAAEFGKNPGDMKLKDINGDGTLVPNDDKVFQGYRNPRYRMGLTNKFTLFRNIEVSAFIRADLGHYGSNYLHLNAIDNSDYERRNRIKTPYWTEDNPINDYARLNSDNNSPSVSYWESRGFVRLQDLSVSYKFPAARLQRFMIKDLRVFCHFRNILTFTSWEHYDPESGINAMPKSATIGINLSL